MMVAVKSRVTF